MKIKANTKGNSLEFIPENSVECYQLGLMFKDIPQTLTIKPEKGELEKTTISTVNIWKHLTK